MSLRFTLHDSSKKKSDWAVKPVWFGSSPSCEKELPRRSRVFTKRLFLDAAAAAGGEAPTRFVLDTAWPALLAGDKRHYLRDKPAAPKHTADQTIDWYFLG